MHDVETPVSAYWVGSVGDFLGWCLCQLFKPRYETRRKLAPPCHVAMGEFLFLAGGSSNKLRVSCSMYFFSRKRGSRPSDFYCCTAH